MPVIERDIIKVLRDYDCGNAEGVTNAELVVHIRILAGDIGNNNACCPNLVPDVLNYRPCAVYFIRPPCVETSKSCCGPNDFIVVTVKGCPEGHEDEGKLRV